MAKRDKVWERVMSGAADANIAFDDLRQLLKRLGFVERVKGSHHIFAKEGIEEILNLQPADSKAKPYQVKQARNAIRKHKLRGKP
ncbi:MAG: type II toxin-antitoxin system HicA family toxin [Chloroflexi bacterium]|nr:type II toxin-antitoxin system HicA family toxin [Chloroflexota bacterium]